jgi:hypothetical protein
MERKMSCQLGARGPFLKPNIIVIKTFCWERILFQRLINVSCGIGRGREDDNVCKSIFDKTNNEKVAKRRNMLMDMHSRLEEQF